jgi:hypothetical protein
MPWTTVADQLWREVDWYYSTMQKRAATVDNSGRGVDEFYGLHGGRESAVGRSVDVHGSGVLVHRVGRGCPQNKHVINANSGVIHRFMVNSAILTGPRV